MYLRLGIRLGIGKLLPTLLGQGLGLGFSITSLHYVHPAFTCYYCAYYLCKYTNVKC